MTAVEVVATAVGVIGFAAALLRWLRVAQREHYLAGSATKFARRWWCSTNANVALISVAAFAAVIAFMWPVAGLVPAAVAVVAPLGLGVRGRTSRLAWTRRLRTSAAVTIVIAVALVLVAGLLLDRVAAMTTATGILAPLLVDAALLLVAPLEHRLARRHTSRAAAMLERIGPLVVAITGSYGKTTTKQYARHLMSGTRRVVASPASFNNAPGLSRAITEQLTPGTEVFIAEMGTYGRGEIAALCDWVKPTVGVITAIGPVHLERMKTLDGIVAAKSEIFECVETAILNVDAYGLEAVADANRLAGKRVLACSAEPQSAMDGGVPVDVRVLRDEGRLLVDAGAGCRAAIESQAQPTNLACAIAIALAVDVPWSDIASRLDDLPRPEHRQELAVAASGVHVIDNTFSSNPASAESSLSLLAFTGEVDARRVVVTPGMVELGRSQHHENERFGSGASLVANDIVVVGRTNRAALLAGAAGGLAAVHTVANREEAVAWVRSALGPGDVVLYENDLPDHHP
jgi:UDP-N-acetylmuramoyl-tripeptide--D-alanyl-D-alanine ligase